MNQLLAEAMNLLQLINAARLAATEHESVATRDALMTTLAFAEMQSRTIEDRGEELFGIVTAPDARVGSMYDVTDAKTEDILNANEARDRAPEGVPA